MASVAKKQRKPVAWSPGKPRSPRPAAPARPQPPPVRPRPLTAAQRRRLNAPVAPGSALTNRQANQQATAQTKLKYEPVAADLRTQAAQAAQRQSDVGGWYDQYLAKLQQGTRNVADIQANAAARLGALGQGATGIATADLNALQADANQRAAQQGMTAGNLAPIAEQAAQSRQNLVGSFQAQQELAGAAQQGYMERLASVIGPTQKLGALAQQQSLRNQIGQKQSDLVRERAAFKTTAREDIRQREQQYGLAAIGLGVKEKAAAASAKASSPQAKYQAEFVKQAAKFGRTPQQWKALGPKGRDRVINADHSKPDTSVYTTGAFAGKRKSDVEGMTDGQRQRLVDAYAKKHGGKSGSGAGGGKGPNWLTPGQAGTGLAQLTSLKDYAAKARSGQAFVKGHQAQPRMSRRQAAQKIRDSVGPPKHPILLTAALDAAYDGHLSANTVRALIVAGYKPSEVARTLGVPTSKTWRQQHSGAEQYPIKSGRGAGQ